MCLSIDVTGALVFFPHPYCTTKVQIFCTEFQFTKVQEHCTKSLFSFTFFFRFVSTGASLGHFLPRFRTCVSVHRRDRCTRTPFLPTLHILVPVSLFWFILLFFSSVLVCLSIDVTGALVLFLFLPCLLPVSLLLSLFWLFSCTCVSVHRRDRCTCTPHTSGLPFAVLFVLLFLLLWLWVVVLGFLFTDVTGAPASC